MLAQKDTTIQTLSETSKLPVDSNILIVVDGSVLGTIRELKIDITKKFPADIIASIDVLKGQRAIDKYGNKGKAGVLEFYLKNVKIIEKEDLADSVFSKVEIEAVFPGGISAWRNFLVKNLNADIPVNKGAPEGTYTVIVQFVVDTEGNISEIKPLTNHGHDMEAEVMRVISIGPKWESAILNGKKVKAYRKQPVTFHLTGDYPFKLSVATIKAGQPTEIEIKELDNVKDEDIEVTLSYGTISHVDGKKYLVTVDKPGKISIKVKKKAKKKKDELYYGSMEITVE